jgi:hypothetical protein
MQPFFISWKNVLMSISQNFLRNIHKFTRTWNFLAKLCEVVNFQDGTLKLGINVDHLDGKSGLLLRRVDPEGLVHQHNLQAWRRGNRRFEWSLHLEETTTALWSTGGFVQK